MHLDACHFFVWVFEHGGKQRLQWTERAGTDLMLHSADDCERCKALRRGAEPIAENIITTIDPPLPEDSKEAFIRILELLAADERMQ